MEHECKLFNIVPVTHLFIDSGLCIHFRRSIMDFVTVSKKHPWTSRVFTSIKDIENEELRLLSSKIYIIHPFSKFTFYWSLILPIVFLIFMWNFLVISINRDMEEDCNLQLFRYHKIQVYIDAFFFVDILRRLLTGYYDDERGKTVLKAKDIVIHYLKTWFFIDFLSCLNSFIYLMGVSDNTLFCILFEFSRLLGILRFLRYQIVIEAIDLLCGYIAMSSILSKIIKSFTMLVLLFHVIVAAIFLSIDYIQDYVVPLKPHKYYFKYEMFFEVVLLLLHATIDTREYLFSSEKIALMFYMTLGWCFQLFLFVQVLRVWRTFTHSRITDILEHFSGYLQYKALPVGLRRKIIKFYEYKYQNRYYNEGVINRMLTKTIKQEILVNITKNHVEQVHFFKYIPDAVMTKLVLKLKTEVFLTNDVIIKAGVPGDSMYFIYFGTVAIYQNDKEICHLDDGGHFGEIALVFNEPRIASVVATTPCELYKLTREDFWTVLQPLPELKEKIINLASERLGGKATSLLF